MVFVLCPPHHPVGEWRENKTSAVFSLNIASSSFHPSIFNDTLWLGKWWLAFPYNSMVVCAERGENCSSHHPHISVAFLRGSHAWVVGLVKPSISALQAVTCGPPPLGGVFMGAMIGVGAHSALQLNPSFWSNRGNLQPSFFALPQFLTVSSGLQSAKGPAHAFWVGLTRKGRLHLS